MALWTNGLVLFFFPFPIDDHHQKFFMFHIFYQIFYNWLVGKFNSKSWSTYLSQSADVKFAFLSSLKHVSVSQVFSTHAERFNFQTIVEVWAGFCFSFWTFQVVSNFRFLKREDALKLFAWNNKKYPPWTHFKLTTPLHTLLK